MSKDQHGQPPAARFAAVTALGIVFGDLGTSPLYTLQTLDAALGGRLSAQAALGVLSLIIWTLLLTISLKYARFVMQADNHGEGGILALMSLIGANRLNGGYRVLTMLGLLGAALIYGDGAITPAISVLSALEGLNVVTDHFKPFTLPMALIILVLLFLFQRLGTGRIGEAFGPIMLVWFAVIGALGLIGVVGHPAVLAALNPLVGLDFLLHSGATAPPILGGVFLCITGGEALYADMGHVGKGPIRLAWYGVVLPALLLSYAGQVALLLGGGAKPSNPFFQLAPDWAIYPMVALATAATIIASQAIITGAFSMTRQAIQLRWLPTMAIRQTSDQVYGQIYVPLVNWLMMAATIGIALTFRSSERLASAFGTAVSTTMLITTLLLALAMLKVWRWPPALALAVSAGFLLIDGAFFGANLLKIADGGWLPLTLGAVLFVVMTTWRLGIDAIGASLARSHQAADVFLAALREGRTPRPGGVAVFLSRSAGVPALVGDYLKFTGSLQSVAMFVNVQFEERPRVPAAERVTVEGIGDGLWLATVRFGFVEIPDLHKALSGAPELTGRVDLDQALYFGGSYLVVRRKGGRTLSLGRLGLFAFMVRNALKVVDRFNLPPDRVLEVAREVDL